MISKYMYEVTIDYLASDHGKVKLESCDFHISTYKDVSKILATTKARADCKTKGLHFLRVKCANGRRAIFTCDEEEFAAICEQQFDVVEPFTIAEWPEIDNLTNNGKLN